MNPKKVQKTPQAADCLSSKPSTQTCRQTKRDRVKWYKKALHGLHLNGDVKEKGDKLGILFATPQGILIGKGNPFCRILHVIAYV